MWDPEPPGQSSAPSGPDHTVQRLATCRSDWVGKHSPAQCYSTRHCSLPSFALCPLLLPVYTSVYNTEQIPPIESVE